ncbi:MAG: hypothetical protein O6840_05250, partial [Nitrospirae bacterium]|nr:hypothetical protein [Nitrospirota bacterium]
LGFSIGLKASTTKYSAPESVSLLPGAWGLPQSAGDGTSSEIDLALLDKALDLVFGSLRMSLVPGFDSNPQ